MTFSNDLRVFAEKLERRGKDVFVGSTVEVQRSVVEGSELTTAPGQPVDTGFLKGSFIPEFISPTEWQITTNTSYAPAIEDNLQSSFDERGKDRPPDLRPKGGSRPSIKSTVGGNHSVKKTRAGWQRILDHVNEAVL